MGLEGWEARGQPVGAGLGGSRWRRRRTGGLRNPGSDADKIPASKWRNMNPGAGPGVQYSSLGCPPKPQLCGLEILQGHVRK